MLLGLAGSAGQAAPPPCASAEHRQFDFWIGEWRVQTPDGALAGINRITREYGGCVVHEHYATGKGYSGESMILEGLAPDAKGVLVKQRITWTPSADGSVRQLWESAGEKGAWTVVFDGKYTKK